MIETDSGSRVCLWCTQDNITFKLRLRQINLNVFRFHYQKQTQVRSVGNFLNNVLNIVFN